MKKREERREERGKRKKSPVNGRDQSQGSGVGRRMSHATPPENVKQETARGISHVHGERTEQWVGSWARLRYRRRLRLRPRRSLADGFEGPFCLTAAMAEPEEKHCADARDAMHRSLLPRRDGASTDNDHLYNRCRIDKRKPKLCTREAENTRKPYGSEDGGRAMVPQISR